MGLLALFMMGLLTLGPFTTELPMLPKGCEYKVVPYDEDGDGGMIFLVVIHCPKPKEKA